MGQGLVGNGKTKLLKHLDILRDLADKVRNQELEKINKYTDTNNGILKYKKQKYKSTKYDDDEQEKLKYEHKNMSEQKNEEGNGMTYVGDQEKSKYDQNDLPVKVTNITKLKPIKSKQKITEMKKIKSIMELSEEQAQELKQKQLRRNKKLR